MITKSNAIVVLRAGSSGLRFAAYAAKDATLGLLARGEIEGLGTGARFRASDMQGLTLADGAIEPAQDMSGHEQAFKYVAGWLQGQFGERVVFSAAGHWIAHGGAEYAEPTLITDEVIEDLEKLVPLAPLHLAHNLAGVKAVSSWRPGLPQVGCFDTAFHCGRSRVVERYSLPEEYLARGVRRWGYHGLSFESVVARFGELMPHMALGRSIVAYLGREASLCALNGSRCVDTTTGFSALDGVPGGSVCGSLDPGAVLYLMRELTAEQSESLLYGHCGLLGISGISGEMRELLASDDPRAAEAVEYFVYRVIREVGSLAAALQGLDALIFTGGIGEHSAQVRARICKGLGWLGVELDREGNERGQGCISRQGRSPSVWVIPADEEGLMARHTMDIVSMLPSRIADGRGGRDDRAAMQH